MDVRLFSRFRPSVPVPLTPVTATVQVLPPSPLVGVPMVPATEPVVPRLKLADVRPLMVSLKVTVKDSLVALVAVPAPVRTMLCTTGAMMLMLKVLATTPPWPSLTWMVKVSLPT